jgi:putative membrane protein
VIGSALLSTLHLLALAIGLPGVFLRGKALRALQKDPTAVERVLTADNLWGVAALLWLATGLTRAFAGFEKGSGFYLNSGAFLVKMGLFGAVLLLELWPMATFIRWRIRKAKGLALDTSRALPLSRVNDAELLLTLAMPLVASMMARGIGFGWFSAGP